MCHKYPDSGDIAVSVKTGATEALKKLPATLSTSLSCVSNVMIFSDLEQTLGDVQIHDVLSNFSQKTLERNPDFELYRKQKELKTQNRESELETLSHMLAPPRDWRTKGKSASWGLDKYKFIPMVEAAYELQPDRDWYVFLEADTYLSWPNLNRWLATLNSNHQLYLGNALQKSDDREPLYFAHGGSGFVLSRAAIKAFTDRPKKVSSALEERMQDWWAGDMMLADAMYDEIGLKVMTAAPMFNQLHSRGIRFEKDSWCEPAITLHHMDATDFEEIFEKEEELHFSSLLLRDVCTTVYSENGLPEKKDDWDNISDASEYSLPFPPILDLDPNTNFERCRSACQRAEECFQFFFRNTTELNSKGELKLKPHCGLSAAFRLGHAMPIQDFDNEDEPGVFRSWTSGWNRTRIAQWVEQNWECLLDY